MADIKIAVIGAGSFVFGPSVLRGILLDHHLSDAEVALVDVDQPMVERMAAVGRRIASENDLHTKFTAHINRAQALSDADFVVCSAAREIQKRFLIDCEIITRCAPGHFITEFGGVFGISYSLRQIALILEITADIKKFAPHAWLLNVANPLPRVCQAACDDGVKTIGFCAVAINGYGMAHQTLTDRKIRYPYKEGLDAYQAELGGVNHFTWILSLKDRKTGENLLPALRNQLAKGATTGQPFTDRVLKETGYLPASGDDHIQDFLVPSEHTRSIAEISHGSPETRQQRMQYLQDIVDGKSSWEPLMTSGLSWEKPVDAIAAIALRKRATFETLNLQNRGQLPDLPMGVYVESPCKFDDGLPVPKKMELPGEIRGMLQRAAEETHCIVQAATERKRVWLTRAIELDPTIIDKSAGLKAVGECLRAHADLLPVYA